MSERIDAQGVAHDFLLVPLREVDFLEGVEPVSRVASCPVEDGIGGLSMDALSARMILRWSSSTKARKHENSTSVSTITRSRLFSLFCPVSFAEICARCERR